MASVQRAGELQAMMAVLQPWSGFRVEGSSLVRMAVKNLLINIPEYDPLKPNKGKAKTSQGPYRVKSTWKPGQVRKSWLLLRNVEQSTKSLKPTFKIPL